MTTYQSFIKGRCPRCRSGNVFKFRIFRILKFRQANEKCPICGVKFESEPGFFWGAMYFSYALTVGMFIVIGAIFFKVYDDPPLAPMILTSLFFAVLTSPFVFRLSRLMMIYLAAPYRHFDSKYAKSEKSS